MVIQAIGVHIYTYKKNLVEFVYVQFTVKNHSYPLFREYMKAYYNM